MCSLSWGAPWIDAWFIPEKVHEACGRERGGCVWTAPVLPLIQVHGQGMQGCFSQTLGQEGETASPQPLKPFWVQRECWAGRGPPSARIWVRGRSSETWGVKQAPASWGSITQAWRDQQGPSTMFQKHPGKKVLALNVCSESPRQQPRKEVCLSCLSSQPLDFAKWASRKGKVFPLNKGWMGEYNLGLDA